MLSLENQYYYIKEKINISSIKQKDYVGSKKNS